MMPSEFFPPDGSHEQSGMFYGHWNHQPQDSCFLNLLHKIREAAPLDSILQAAVIDARQRLQADRVTVFRCRSQMHLDDECVAEAVLPESTPLQTQASLTVPLFYAKQQWGVLCVHQCTRSRQWQPDEVSFVQHVALHLEIAIQQTEGLAQTRQQTQGLLKRYAEQVTDLYNNAPCGYHSIDEEGFFIQINETELTWLGYSRESIIGKVKFSDLLTIESRELFERDFLVFKQRGFVQDLDLEMIRIDGTILPVLLRATAVKDPQGRYLMSRSTVYNMTNRRQAEKEVKQQQWLLRSILDNIPHRVWFKDEVGTYIAINQAHSLAIGLAPEQLIGKTEFEIWSYDEAEVFRQEDLRVMEAGQSIAFEEQVTLPDGTESWFTTIKTPVYNHLGMLIGVTGISMDITDRKRVEQQLQASRIFLDAVLNGTSDPIFVKNEDYCWVQFNDAFCTFMGATREELLGKTDYDLYAPEQADRYRKQDHSVLATGIECITEEAIFNDEETHFIAVKKTYFEDATANKFLVGTIHDITNQKRAEAEIRRQQHLLRAILDNIPHRIWFKDREGKHQVVNQSFSRAVGMEIGAILGNTDRAIWPSVEAETFIQEDQQVMQTEQPVVYEERVPITEGLRWFVTTKAPVYDEAGLVIGTTGISMDITDRKLAELTVQEAKQSLEYRVKERTIELQQTVSQLQQEISDRQKAEQALLLYKYAVNSSSDAIGFATSTGHHFYQNLAFSQLFGCETVEGFNELGGIAVLHTQPEMAQTMFQQMMKGQSWIAETEFQARTGRCFQGLLRIDAIRNQTGEVLGLVVSITDISERKQAEVALIKEREFLKALLNHFEDGIVACDENGILTLFNRATREFHGLPEQALPAEEWANHFDLFREDGITRMQVEEIPLFRAFQGEIVKNVEMMIVPKQGKCRTLLASGQAFFDGQGKKLGAVVVMHDITDRKQAEAALLQSEMQLREKAEREQLLNQLTKQIRSSLDVNRILATAVEMIREFLDIDRCLFIWYRLDEEEPYWEIIQEAKKAEMVSMIGSRISTSENALITQKGIDRELLCVDDITKLVEASEIETCPAQAWVDLSLRHFSLQNYRAILKLPVHTQSGEVGLVSCSHSQPRRWQDSEVELLQAVADSLAIAIDQAELYKQSRLSGEMAQRQAERLEQTLEELQRTQSQMIQSEKMSSLGQLVAGVAHEINNPVNFIYGNLSHANDYTQDLIRLIQLYQQYYPDANVEILQEADAIDLDFLVEDLPKLLSSMRVGAERIQQIVASLRTFSRMDEAEFKAVDLHEGIDSTLMILQNRLKARSVRTPEIEYYRPTIEVIKEYSDLPPVECYAGQLNQVFMNILSNAIDAIEDGIEQLALNTARSKPLATLAAQTEIDTGYSIRICTEALDGDRIVIRIADNGPGMPEAVRQRLFDPFFTTKPVGKGTGMGMSISYQIVTEKHGGTLRCVSAPGQGAEFIIEIPMHQ
ncbi:PAS domain S-box protein [Thermocoleostomius sinensis]|uniref:histidine kinase n=1 Tax=Thermocoleostomius sinensis A174 TaxID=2016057 RepID=A0A9E8ZBX4_9CYAN|nr:PAS domain S-box protein [Thermocoleostomius sinensis]WAL60007.1 PAS domain S-box protein [Thermocoleostomius sinensis A174]